MALTKRYSEYKRYDDVVDYSRYYQQNGSYPNITAITEEKKRFINNYTLSDSITTTEGGGAHTMTHAVTFNLTATTKIKKIYALVSYQLNLSGQFKIYRGAEFLHGENMTFTNTQYTPVVDWSDLEVNEITSIELEIVASIPAGWGGDYTTTFYIEVEQI